MEHSYFCVMPSRNHMAYQQWRNQVITKIRYPRHSYNEDSHLLLQIHPNAQSRALLHLYTNISIILSHTDSQTLSKNELFLTSSRTARFSGLSDELSAAEVDSVAIARRFR